jgi:hypothetical protein
LRAIRMRKGYPDRLRFQNKTCREMETKFTAAPTTITTNSVVTTAPSA